MVLLAAELMWLHCAREAGFESTVLWSRHNSIHGGGEGCYSTATPILLFVTHHTPMLLFVFIDGSIRLQGPVKPHTEVGIMNGLAAALQTEDSFPQVSWNGNLVGTAFLIKDLSLCKIRVFRLCTG